MTYQSTIRCAPCRSVLLAERREEIAYIEEALEALLARAEVAGVRLLDRLDGVGAQEHHLDIVAVPR